MFIEDRFLIRAIPGYSPRVGELVVMMEYARTGTIQEDELGHCGQIRLLRKMIASPVIA
jgi:hypothetical protein